MDQEYSEVEILKSDAEKFGVDVREDNEFEADESEVNHG